MTVLSTAQNVSCYVGDESDATALPPVVSSLQPSGTLVGCASYVNLTNPAAPAYTYGTRARHPVCSRERRRHTALCGPRGGTLVLSEAVRRQAGWRTARRRTAWWT